MRVFPNPSLSRRPHTQNFSCCWPLKYIFCPVPLVSSVFFEPGAVGPEMFAPFFAENFFSALLPLTCCRRNYRQETFLTSLLYMYTSTFCRQKCPGAVETNVATLLSPFFAPPQSKVLDLSLGNNPTTLLHPDGRFIVLLLHVLAITSLVSATIYATK